MAKPAAIGVGHVAAAMAHDLPFDAFLNTRVARIVREGVTERVEYHLLVGDAALSAQIAAEPLPPFLGQRAVRGGHEFREQASFAVGL